MAKKKTKATEGVEYFVKHGSVHLAAGDVRAKGARIGAEELEDAQREQLLALGAIEARAIEVEEPEPPAGDDK